MNAFKIIVFITALILLTSLIFWSIDNGAYRLFIGSDSFLTAPGYNRTDRFLKANYDELSYVADELSKMGYEYVSIDIESIMRGFEDYNMEVRLGYMNYDTVPIPEELINHINILYEKGVQRIGCGEHVVNFTIWRVLLSDETRGIYYSIDGTAPYGEQLIELKPLSKANWYFYVHNYEKAKILHPERFM